MANLSESYDKAALIVSLLLALGLGAMVLMAKGKVEEDFPAATGGARLKAPENPNEKNYKAATSEIGSKVTLEGPVTSKGRKIENFVGTPLFLKEDVTTPIDLGDPSYKEMVHDPIPNQWWLDHRIDPGWDNSPSLDQDGDGFANREEFDAKTDPNDPKSFPSLIAKLQCVRLKKRAFMLTYSSDSTVGKIKDSDTFKFNHEEIVNNRKVRTSSQGELRPGKGPENSNVFDKGGAQMRYEFKKIEQRTFENPGTGVMQTANFATLEDVGAAKKGDIIELKKGSRNGVIVKDWTAVLVLAAIGEEAKELQIEERSRFALPFDPNAVKKPYTFAGVSDAGAAIVEWKEDGETKSMDLQPVTPAN